MGMTDAKIKWARYIPLIGCLLVFFGGIAFVSLEGDIPLERLFRGKVSDLLPTEGELSGWSVRSEPIAETVEMQKVVEDVLSYDDAEYRIYVRGNLRISVYLAYWRPGKMLVRAIAHHTPDVCWPKSGWICTEREARQDLPLGNSIAANTEHRVFTLQGQTEHVVFWHVVGDEIIAYSASGRPPWHAALTDLLRWGTRQKKEQFFIRISSNRPLEEFWPTDVVNHVLRGISAIARPVGDTEGGAL